VVIRLGFGLGCLTAAVIRSFWRRHGHYLLWTVWRTRTAVSTAH